MPTATPSAAPDPATVAPSSVAQPTTTPYSVVAHRPAGLDQLPARQVVAPIRLRIDGHGIDAAVVAVSAYADDGELAVPPSPEQVAWYEHGPAPGEAGSAVLAAHVDWDGRRGPFFTLDSVPADAVVVTTLADGREVSYRVVRVERVAKAELPRDEIFARDGPPRLVLITCGGSFDRDRGHYADNVVLFAELL
jgi:Sortase domain